MAYYSHSIAAGYNVALLSLVNIESIKPTSDKYFIYPLASPLYDPGTYRIRGDGSVYVAGFPAIDWQFTGMTKAQYEYARTTWCNGGFSGQVTIYTRPGTTAYARYNAVLILPKPTDMKWAGDAFEDVKWKFRRLVAL
jgi:hypothetical protein